MRTHFFVHTIHPHAHISRQLCFSFLSVRIFFFRLSVALLFCFALSSRFRSLSLSRSRSLVVFLHHKQHIRRDHTRVRVFSIRFRAPILSFPLSLSRLLRLTRGRALALHSIFLFLLSHLCIYRRQMHTYIRKKRTENEEDERARTTDRMKEEEWRWWYCS